MKNIYKIYKTISKTNSKMYNLKTTSAFLVFFSKISNLFTPIFIIFNIRPNFITLLKFFISIAIILLVFIGSNQLFFYAIGLYLFYIMIDFCDGSVARYHKITSFYGKYIDGLSDIFFESFFILSLSFYSFKIYDSLGILILGSVSAIFTLFDTFIYDRYSALVRWHNLESGKKITPYIGKTVMQNLFFFLRGLYFLLIISLLFTGHHEEFLKYNIILIFLVVFFKGFANNIRHLFYAYKNLSLDQKALAAIYKKNKL